MPIKKKTNRRRPTKNNRRRRLTRSTKKRRKRVIKRRKSKTRRKSKKYRKSKKNKHIISRKKNLRMLRGGHTLNDPFLPDPEYLHTNMKMKGGGFLHDFGLGDALSAYYKGNVAAINTYNTYKGHKKLPSPDVTVQPRMSKYFEPDFQSPNIPSSYERYSSRLN